MNPSLSRLGNPKKIALITFFSNLYFYTYIGTLYAQTRGLNLLQVSSIWSIIVGTVFICEVPTGVIADKIGRKWSLVAALSLQLLGEVLYLFARDYPFFVCIAVIGGVGYAFSSGCTEAIVYESLPQKSRELEMKKAMGLNGAAYQLAFIVAPIIGGLIVSEFVMNRFLLVIFLTACSVAIALLITLTLKEPQKLRDHTGERSIQIFRDGVKQLRSNRKLQRIVVVSVFSMAFSGSLMNLYQPYFVRAGVVSFLMGGAVSLGAFLALWGEKYAYRIEQKLGKRIGLLALSILPGFLYVILAAFSHPIGTVVVFVFTYGTINLKSPLLSAYQNEEIASRNRATVLSLINMFSRCYEATMGLVIGGIADISIVYAFAFIGGLVILCPLVLRVDKLLVN